MCNEIKRIIYVLILSGNLAFAQELDIIELRTDSIKTQIPETKILLFNSGTRSKSPLLLLGKQYDPYSSSIDFIVPTTNNPGNKKNNFDYNEKERIRNEINMAMQVYREGQLKTDLGVVGQVLGYSQTAAAIGLIVYHLYKFKKKK